MQIRSDEYRLKKKQWDKAWRLNNLDKRRVYEQNRRARKRLAEGVITKQVIDTLLIMQGAWCYYCFCDILNSFHIEHKTPLSKGGTNLHDNLCLSCEKCNLEKGTKTEQEYLDWRIIIEQNQ